MASRRIALNIALLGTLIAIAIVISSWESSGQDRAGESSHSSQTKAVTETGRVAAPRRRGVDAPVIYTLSPALLAEGSCGAVADSTLEATQVRADDRSVYIDLRHRAPHQETGARQMVHITTTLLLDGCPVAPPPIDGTVESDQPEPTTGEIALDELPDGELDLGVIAFDREVSLPLLKQGKVITHLPLNRRKNYVYTPPDPEDGEMASEGLIEPDCSRKDISL